MIELNITDFFHKADTYDYSSSLAHSRQRDIAQITWNNALNSEYAFVSAMSGSQVDELREHFADFGAWGHSEIQGWSVQELNALLVQFISADIQEQTDKNGDLYAEDNPIREQVGISIFRDENGEVWFSCGD